MKVVRLLTRVGVFVGLKVGERADPIPPPKEAT